MFNADFDDAFEHGDGVFGDQLLEGDEEASLEGDAAADGCERAGDVAGEREPGDVDEEGEGVWDEGDDEEEFAEFGRAPGALEVLAAVEEGCEGDDEGEDVLLDEGGSEEGPGEDEGEGGDDGEEGDGEVFVAGGGGGVCGVGLAGHPVTVAEGACEDGEGDGEDERDPC